MSETAENDDPQGEVERVAHALCADMNSNDPRAIERVFDETDSKWDHARSCYRKWAGIAIAALRPSAGAGEIEALIVHGQLGEQIFSYTQHHYAGQAYPRFLQAFREMHQGANFVRFRTRNGLGETVEIIVPIADAARLGLSLLNAEHAHG